MTSWLERWKQNKWWLTLREKGWGKRGIWGDKTGVRAKYSGSYKHLHTRENARRRRQIAKGILKPFG